MQGTTDEEQFAMIRSLMPAARVVAIPIDSDREEVPARLDDLIAIGRISGLDVVRLPVSLSRGAVSSTIRDLPRGEAAILIDKESLPDAPVDALVGAAIDNGLPAFAPAEDRGGSEERRVGTERVRKGRYRWSAEYIQKQ